MDAIPMHNLDSIAPSTGPPTVAISENGLQTGNFHQTLTDSMPEETALPGLESMLEDAQLLAFLAGQTGDAVSQPNTGRLDTTVNPLECAVQPDTALITQPGLLEYTGQSVDLNTGRSPAETAAIDGLKTGLQNPMPPPGTLPVQENPKPETMTAIDAMPQRGKTPGPNQTGHSIRFKATTDIVQQQETPKAEIKTMDLPELVEAPKTPAPEHVEVAADPRFSKLLGKIAEPKPDLKSQIQQSVRAGVTEPDVRTVQEAELGKLDVTLDNSSDKGVEQLLTKSSPVTIDQTPAQQAFQVHKAAGTMEQPVKLPEPTATIRLTSGQMFEERRIFDQVVGQIRTSSAGDSGRATLRLYPEELGEVRLDLRVENDRLRATLQAQNSQVQDVLERHLPRLKDALEQHGLRIEALQVSVDSGQGETGARHQQFAEHFPGGRQGSTLARSHQQQQPEQTTATIANRPVHVGQGLSLRI